MSSERRFLDMFASRAFWGKALAPQARHEAIRIMVTAADGRSGGGSRRWTKGSRDIDHRGQARSRSGAACLQRCWSFGSDAVDHMRFNKDRVPVASYVYCTPVAIGWFMSAIGVVSFGSQRSQGCLLPAVADNHYAFTTARSSPDGHSWPGRRRTAFATS